MLSKSEWDVATISLAPTIQRCRGIWPVAVDNRKERLIADMTSARQESKQARSSGSSVLKFSKQIRRLSRSSKKSTSEPLEAWKVGDRVSVAVSGKEAWGSLRFLGPVEFSAGTWCGVELDDELGSHDGFYKGVKYFACRQNHGVLKPVQKVKCWKGTSAIPTAAEASSNEQDAEMMKIELRSVKSLPKNSSHPQETNLNFYNRVADSDAESVRLRNAWRHSMFDITTNGHACEAADAVALVAHATRAVSLSVSSQSDFDSGNESMVMSPHHVVQGTPQQSLRTIVSSFTTPTPERAKVIHKYPQNQHAVSDFSGSGLEPQDTAYSLVSTTHSSSGPNVGAIDDEVPISLKHEQVLCHSVDDATDCYENEKICSDLNPARDGNALPVWEEVANGVSHSKIPVLATPVRNPPSNLVHSSKGDRETEKTRRSSLTKRASAAITSIPIRSFLRKSSKGGEEPFKRREEVILEESKPCLLPEATSEISKKKNSTTKIRVAAIESRAKFKPAPRGERRISNESVSLETADASVDTAAIQNLKNHGAPDECNGSVHDMGNCRSGASPAKQRPHVFHSHSQVPAIDKSLLKESCQTNGFIGERPHDETSIKAHGNDETLEKKLQDLDLQCENIKEELCVRNKYIAELEARCDALKTDLATKDATILTLQSCAERASEDLEVKNKNISNLKVEIESLQWKLSELDVKLTESEQLSGSLNLTILDKDRLVTELTAQKLNYYNSINKTRSLLLLRTTAFESILIVLQNYLNKYADLSEEYTRLRSHLLHAQQELRLLEDKLTVECQSRENILEELAQCHKSHAQEILSLNQAQEQHIKSLHESLIVEKEAELNKLSVECSSKIEALSSAHREFVAQMQSSNDNKLLELRLLHQQEMSRTEQENLVLVRNKEREHTELISSIRHEQERAVLELKENIKRLEDEKDALRRSFDADSRVQTALAKYKHLPDELMSLQAVVEIKNEKIKHLELSNMELQKKAEDYYKLKEKHEVLLLEKENLKVALESKKLVERQVSVDRDAIAARLERESRKVQRLSMEKEELMWRASNPDLSFNSSSEEIGDCLADESPPCLMRSSGTLNALKSRVLQTKKLNRRSVNFPIGEDGDFS